MLFEKNDAQLVLVSCQKNLCVQSLDAKEFTAQVQKLASVAQIFRIPIWSVIHMPQLWGEQMDACEPFCAQPMESALFSVADTLAPHLNPVRRQPAGNARSMPKHLQKTAENTEPQRPVIVLAGCQAHVGVVQTALDLMEVGYEPMVVVDACTSIHLRDRDAAFDRLAAAGVELTTVDMLCMEWLRSSADPQSMAVMKALTPT